MTDTFLKISLLILITLYSCTQNMGQENNTEQYKHTNKLISQTSPYLLQHAHNPVDWNPWSPEALAQAVKEDKLLIISIGYAACHWCHVMEHESFEDSIVAVKMNANYVSIKVDREERPDIDQIYMDAAQLMTGRGGWPLNVIALPDGRPVYAGTYFPKENWEKVLDYFQAMYKNDPDKLREQAEKVTEGINQLEVPELNTDKNDFDPKLYRGLADNIVSQTDQKKGGRQGAPKFPMPTVYEFLLTQDYFLEDQSIQDALRVTLDHMADGGIYDHLGGGFARYSTDVDWTVPHFEKMLYDNAQLISLYSHAYQYYGDEKYRQAVVETIEFCNRELTDPSGGFYSSLDADSEGEEGKFYVWTIREIERVLGKDARLFATYYGMSQGGNFEGKNILERKTDIAQLAKEFAKSETEISKIIDESKAKLMKIRDQRIRPGLDDKILTSWNGLMIIGLVDAYFAIGEKSILERALLAGNFVADNQTEKNGRLLRNYKEGKSNISGFLDDYAYTILAFIKLYEATFDEVWLSKAKELKEYTDQHFTDSNSQMYFYTADNDEKLIARKMELSDNVIPASNSSMAHALFLLGQYYSNDSDLARAKQMVANATKDFMANPSYYSNWARLYGLMGQRHYEVAIVGSAADQLKMEFAQSYLPNKIMLGGTKESKLDLLKDKLVDSKTLLYVCENKACLLPVSNTKLAKDQITNQ